MSRGRALDELLEIVDLVHRVHVLPVLQDGRGEVAVLQEGREPAPAPDHRLDDGGVAQRFKGLERRLLGERDEGPGRRDSGSGEREAAEELVAGDVGRLEAVHDAVAHGLQCRCGVDVPVVADAPLEDQVVGNPAALPGRFERELSGVYQVHLDALLLGGVHDGLLLPAYQVVEEGERSHRYSPQSSSSSSAGRTESCPDSLSLTTS